MNSIRQVYIIAAPPKDVWRALTDPNEIRKWTGASALFPVEVGAKYALWNGEITGKIVEVDPNRRLVQTWKPQDWTIENSVVTFTLTPHGKFGTQVDLYHENVEGKDYSGTNESWDLYYLGAIKKMLEGRAVKAAPPKKAAVKISQARVKKNAPKTKSPIGEKAAKRMKKLPSKKKKVTKRIIR